MKRIITLSADQLLTSRSTLLYLENLFQVQEATKSFSQLYDAIIKEQDDIDIRISEKDMQIILQSKTAYKILLMLGRASDANPNIQIHFCR